MKKNYIHNVCVAHTSLKTRKALQTVNGKRYRHMLNTFLRPVATHLRNRHELWFQQDGATCRTANETMNELQGMFGNNIISRRGALTWPPRLPDLNTTDLYIWGYLKERVYINRPETLEDFKDNTRREIRAISPAMLRFLMNNSLVRARSCIAVEGQHVIDITFPSYKSPDSHLLMGVFKEFYYPFKIRP